MFTMWVVMTWEAVVLFHTLKDAVGLLESTIATRPLRCRNLETASNYSSTSWFQECLQTHLPQL